MKYDHEKRSFLVKKFYESQSTILVQRAWRTKYKNIKAPSGHMIKSTISRFEKTGSVDNSTRSHPSRAQKREEAKISLKTLIEEKPNLSIRKLMQQAQTSFSMTRNILRNDLMLKPYKQQTCHRLIPTDYPKRVDFASWLLKLSSQSHEWIICTDEAWFSLTPEVNNQNNRVWTLERPLDSIQVPLHDQKVMVFCAISANKIYGPYYFEGNVDSKKYHHMLENWFWKKHLDTPNYRKYYFQQDGATPHTSNLVQNWLSEKFGEKFLDKKKWPPRSPDLNPCDFFLWGHLKSKVYYPLPKNIIELKANIEREIKSIKKEVLKKTFENFRKRLELIILAEGKYIENVL